MLQKMNAAHCRVNHTPQASAAAYEHLFYIHKQIKKKKNTATDTDREMIDRLKTCE